MEIPAKTYNEKFESFLKILESDDRFDNVCKNFLESICSALYVNAATVTVSGYENSEPLSYELIADTHKYTVYAFDKEFNLMIAITTPSLIYLKYENLRQSYLIFHK